MKDAPRSERSLLWLLAGIQLTLLLDFMVLMPLGPELMAKLQISAAVFGGLVSSYTLASAIGGVSGLFWLGRFERKRILLALYAGFALATIGCACATSSVTLLAARVLAGACAGLLWAVVMDVIIETVPEERRGSAIGLVMSAYAVAAVAGVPLGLWLGTRWAEGLMADIDPEAFRWAVVVAPTTYALAAAIALLASAASTIWIQRSLERLDLIAALKTRD